MIEYFHRIIINQDRTLIFYLNATNDTHSFFTFNEESRKSIATDNNYGEKSSNSIIKCYFNNNTCFLIEESIFNYLLSNALSSHKFINSVGCSIFTTTSSSLIKSILSSKKISLFHHHHKKYQEITSFVCKTKPREYRLGMQSESTGQYKQLPVSLSQKTQYRYKINAKGSTR